MREIVERYDIVHVSDVFLSDRAGYRVEVFERIYDSPPSESVPPFSVSYWRHTESGLERDESLPWVAEWDAEAALQRALHWLTHPWHDGDARA